MQRFRRGLWLALILSVTLVVGIVRAQDARDQSDTASAATRADDVMSRWNESGPGCSAAVSRSGEIVYRRAAGSANLEYATPLAPTSIFHVASVSKQFTAMSVLLLAERGALGLDDEVRKYEPRWMTTPAVTIRQLLNHTSGLRDVFLLTEMAAPGDRGLGQTDWLLSLVRRQQHLNFAPGSEFQYSNAGYLVLADIVGRVSGQPFSTFAKANIFDPLGMADTFFHDDAAMIVRNRATGYVRRGNGFGLAIGFDSLVGNAGLFTTPSDLLRWEDNLATPRVGSMATVRSMEADTPLTSGGTTGYGFGLWIATQRGRRTFGHGGGDPGVSAQTLRFPDDGLAVAVTCNLDDIDSLTPALDLADAFLGAHPVATNTTASSLVTVSTDRLTTFAGLYRDPLTQLLLRFRVRDGVLRGSAGAGDDEPGWAVSPQNAATFLIPDTSITIAFKDDGSGLRVVGEKPQPIILERLPDNFHASAIDIAAATGRYTNAELDVTYAIAQQGNELSVTIPNRKPIAMQSVARDTFVASYLGVIRFSRDAGDRIVGLSAHSPGVRNIQFERVR